MGRRGWDRGKARGAFVRPDTWKSISVMDRGMESFKEILLEAKKEAARVAPGVPLRLATVEFAVAVGRVPSCK